MADLRTLVHEQMQRGGSPEYSFEDLRRRRDQRQRNQRIASDAIGLAVFLVFVTAIVVGTLVEGGARRRRDRRRLRLRRRARPSTDRGDLPTIGLPGERRLEPGRYRLTVGGVRITFAVPAGWTGWTLGATDTAWASRPPKGRLLGFWNIERVYADPCRWDRGYLDGVGAGVDDLVAALEAQPRPITRRRTVCA